MEFAEFSTIWSIRGAVACYFIALGMLLWSQQRGKECTNRARGFWTMGCALCILHVLCAFHFFHHWSHAAAWQHTAEQTRLVVGWEWGNGLFFNYAFVLFWVVDVVYWWFRPREHGRRNGLLKWITHGFMLFIIINATIVFESGAIRWIATALFSGLLGVWLICESRRANSSRPTKDRDL